MNVKEVEFGLILTVVIMRIIVICDVMRYSLVDRVSAFQANLLASFG
jgi:hypothetical protein